MRPLVVLGLFSLALAPVDGQMLVRTAYSCSGSSAHGSGYYLSYTIGQTVFHTLDEESNVLTEGFQQPLFRGRPVPGTYVNAYPNPVFEKLTVIISVREPADISLELMSIIGVRLRKVEFKRLVGFHEYQMDFSGIRQGLYLLRVYSDSDRNLDNIFKIEKL